MLFLIVKAAKLKAGKTGKTGKTSKFDEHKINRDSDGKFSSKPGSKKASPAAKVKPTMTPADKAAKKQKEKEAIQ